MEDMAVAFSVDGGRRLGMGHVNRCLSIAKYLASKDIRCFFLISNPFLAQIVSAYGTAVRIRYLSEDRSVTRFLSREKGCKVLIIDSKHDYVSKILRRTRRYVRIVLIDNVKYYENCDLVVLPGVNEQFIVHPKNSLVGPEYVLLNPSFRATPSKKRNGRILFSAGSADKFDITRKVLLSFKRSSKDFQMTVVLGRFYNHIEEIKNDFGNDPRFTILIDPKDFPALLGLHSLGIITFGISVYEAAAARLPILVISHSNENDISAKRVEKYSWMKYIGKYNNIDYDKIVDEALVLLGDKQLLRRMSEAGKIVDDRGPQRVGDAIINLMKGSDPL